MGNLVKMKPNIKITGKKKTRRTSEIVKKRKS